MFSAPVVLLDNVPAPIAVLYLHEVFEINEEYPTEVFSIIPPAPRPKFNEFTSKSLLNVFAPAMV